MRGLGKRQYINGDRQRTSAREKWDSCSASKAESGQQCVAEKEPDGHVRGALLFDPRAHVPRAAAKDAMSERH